MASTTGSETDVFEDINLPPFDHPDGDVIVRSTIGKADYRVCKAFLNFSSPFWQGMFTMPQGNLENETKNGCPVIPLNESKETLETLLRLIYPPSSAEAPTLDSLAHAVAVLEAAMKYTMDGVEKHVRKELISRFLDEDPMRLFAIAHQHCLGPEMRMAAKQTLRMPILGRRYIDELELISGGVYHKLQEYHQQCGRLASELSTNLQWITKDTFVWFECTDCARSGSSAAVTLAGNRRKWVYSKWWLEFMNAASTALMVKPSRHTLQNSDLVEEALGRACATCNNCRIRVFRDMREFCEMFGAEIDRVVGNVALEIQV